MTDSQCTTLIIARHGNNFSRGEPVTRLGITDKPLAQSGRTQAAFLGQYLHQQKLLPDIVYASQLSRTQETASIALDTMKLGHITPVIHPMFNEIDYGPDENQPEDAVIARLGKRTLHLWDTQCIPPSGWHVNVPAIITSWHDFAHRARHEHAGKTILVVTSNGVARFAPQLTDDPDGFAERFTLKLPTGALGILTNDTGTTRWQCDRWNIRPIEHISLEE